MIHIYTASLKISYIIIKNHSPRGIIKEIKHLFKILNIQILIIGIMEFDFHTLPYVITKFLVK